ncbi:hypothetical protein T439DRAFT_143668 [Meredithblackwellia eburnea MCA 4105]
MGTMPPVPLTFARTRSSSTSSLLPSPIAVLDSDDEGFENTASGSKDLLVTSFDKLEWANRRRRKSGPGRIEGESASSMSSESGDAETRTGPAWISSTIVSLEESFSVKNKVELTFDTTVRVPGTSIDPVVPSQSSMNQEDDPPHLFTNSPQESNQTFTFPPQNSFPSFSSNNTHHQTSTQPPFAFLPPHLPQPPHHPGYPVPPFFFQNPFQYGPSLAPHFHPSDQHHFGFGLPLPPPAYEFPPPPSTVGPSSPETSPHSPLARNDDVSSSVTREGSPNASRDSSPVPTSRSTATTSSISSLHQFFQAAAGECEATKEDEEQHLPTTPQPSSAPQPSHDPTHQPFLQPPLHLSPPSNQLTNNPPLPPFPAPIYPVRSIQDLTAEGGCAPAPGAYFSHQLMFGVNGNGPFPQPFLGQPIPLDPAYAQFPQPPFHQPFGLAHAQSFASLRPAPSYHSTTGVRLGAYQSGDGGGGGGGVEDPEICSVPSCHDGAICVLRPCDCGLCREHLKFTIKSMTLEMEEVDSGSSGSESGGGEGGEKGEQPRQTIAEALLEIGVISPHLNSQPRALKRKTKKVFKCPSCGTLSHTSAPVKKPSWIYTATPMSDAVEVSSHGATTSAVGLGDPAEISPSERRDSTFSLKFIPPKDTIGANRRRSLHPLSAPTSLSHPIQFDESRWLPAISGSFRSFLQRSSERAPCSLGLPVITTPQ